MIWEGILWASIALVAYTYFGYPALMWSLARFRGKAVSAGEVTPTVSLIIAAYNEEKVIRQKLENCLRLEYPVERLEIIVSSDGSSDRTNEIVREFAVKGIRLNALPRLGKTEAQNRTVQLARGEVIVFTDATSMFEPCMLRKLVRSLADCEVGAVCGWEKSGNTGDSAVSSGEGMYERYETFLRYNEGLFRSCISLEAGLMAVRRELFVPLASYDSEDFVIPLLVAARGKRAVFDPDVFFSERFPSSYADDFGLRVRTAHGDSYSLFRMGFLFNPFRPFLVFQCLSHKVLRWSVGYLSVIALVANVMLWGVSPYEWLLFGQLAFYTLAMIGLLFYRRGTLLGPFHVPFYACAVNLGVVVGLTRTIRGVPYTTKWEPIQSER